LQAGTLGAAEASDGSVNSIAGEGKLKYWTFIG